MGFMMTKKDWWKTPDREPNGRKLAPDQSEWHAGWKGQACVVESIDDALRVIVEIGEAL